MTERAQVTRLVGVYDADGSVRGELAYAVGHLLGRRECALCDITHAGIRRKRSFDLAAGGLGVPFDLRHRDELTSDERAAAHGALPCVLVETDGAPTVLLDREALSRCDGEPAALVDAIRRTAAERALTLP